MRTNTVFGRMLSFLITICILVPSFNVVLAEDENSSEENETSLADIYPDAKLSFDGFTMQYGANGKVQGLVDVTLANVNATGVSFALTYDSDYIVPSDYDTNEPTTDFLSMFAQNEDVFPIVMNEYVEEKNYLKTTYSTIDASQCTVEAYILPDTDTPNSDYIGEGDYSYPVTKK